MRWKNSCSHFPEFPARRARKQQAGFTLMELLVSMGLLALMILMVAQLTSSAGTTVGNSGKHMDADTQARLILNRMGVDFSRMLKRGDLDYTPFKQPAGTLPPQYGGAAIAANPQAGNDQMAFYSEADGYFSGTATPAGTQKSTVSLVAYNIATDPYSGQPVLRRMGKGLGWEPSTAVAGSTSNWANVAYLPVTMPSWYLTYYPGRTGVYDNTDPDYKTVGDLVFRMEYNYLIKATSTHAARLSITPWDTTVSTHTSISGFQDVAAIVVTLAVLDPASRVIINNNNYTNLTGSTYFTDATDGADVAAAWNAEANSATFASDMGIPKSAASAVRIYERYFYLDTH